PPTTFGARFPRTCNTNAYPIPCGRIQCARFRPSSFFRSLAEEPVMNVRQSERHLPGYLDGAISSRDHANVREHLATCQGCQIQLERYRRLAVCLANVRAEIPPADLALRIRIRASQHLTPAARLRKAWSSASLTFENFLKPLAVPATCGILTALVVFVLVA